MIEWQGMLGYMRGDVDDVAELAHALRHILAPDHRDDETRRPAELTERDSLLRTHDTAVARVLVDERALDIPVPPDGMTAAALGAIAVEATGWQSGVGAAVVTDATTDAVIPMSSAIHAGATYRLRAAR